MCPVLGDGLSGCSEVWAVACLRGPACVHRPEQLPGCVRHTKEYICQVCAKYKDCFQASTWRSVWYRAVKSALSSEMDYPVVRKFGQSPVCGDQHVSIAQNSSLVVLEYAKYVLNIKTVFKLLHGEASGIELLRVPCPRSSLVVLEYAKYVMLLHGLSGCSEVWAVACLRGPACVHRPEQLPGCVRHTKEYICQVCAKYKDCFQAST